MQRCTHCHGKFGLVRHHWWRNQFCSKACKHAFLGQRERLNRWLYGDLLSPGPGAFSSSKV
jgi:hypothetical protein